MRYDVAVIGGGTGGVPAALAAARNGARTVLVERYGFLGGMATAGLVNPYMGWHAGRKALTAGIFAEIIEGLSAGAGLHENGHTFDEEVLKLVLDRLVRDAGVTVLFHSTFVSCARENGRITSATIVSKGGPFEIEADCFVDATGDADLAAAAGARIEIGRPSDGLCQPMTLCFRIAGIDRSALPGEFAELRRTLNEIYLAAKADGRVTNPREDILVFKTLRPDTLHFNTTRVTGLSPVSPEELSEAEFEGRRQAAELVELFRAEAPGFADTYLHKSGVLIGVRESRRVMGAYVLEADDILGARKFDDAIACSRYPIDIHSPSGEGTLIRTVPEGDWYEIPYRCIVPSGLDNLLMATRAVSATHEAHASLRVMPVVAAIAEAAGTAAAMASENSIAPAGIDPAELRGALRRAGAFVGEGQ